MNFDVSSCTEFQISGALPQTKAPDPTGGAYSASPDSLAGVEGLTVPLQEPHFHSRPFGPRVSYLSICGLRKGPGKFLMGVLESPGKVLDFFVSKRVGTLAYCCCLAKPVVTVKNKLVKQTKCVGA